MRFFWYLRGRPLKVSELKVPELKSLAKQFGLNRYSKLRKQGLIKIVEERKRELIREAELESDRKRNSSSLFDESVPEIKIPILKPTPVSLGNKVATLRSLAGKMAESVTRKVNKFADWVVSIVPDPIRRTANEKVNKLRSDVKRIFKQAEYFNPRQKETALKGYLKTYRIDGVEGYDVKTFIANSKLRTLNLIEKRKKPIKLKLILTCKFFKENPATGKVDENYGYFHSFVETITEASDLSELFNVMTSRLIELSQQFQNQGSGWQFSKVEALDILADPFQPLSGSTYIPLPKSIADKNAIINVKNLNDNYCFKWAVTSAIYTAKNHPERLNKKMRDNSEKFNWSGIEFPVSLKQIDKFEKQNNLAVNVFGIESAKVYLLRISEARDKVLIDLLLISNGNTNQYCWVKNKSRLLSSEVSKHKSVRFFCDGCINHFPNKPALEKHLEYCSNNKAVRIEFPRHKNKDGEELDCPVLLKFKNFNRSMRVPFVIYADFECYTESSQLVILMRAEVSQTSTNIICPRAIAT